MGCSILHCIVGLLSQVVLASYRFAVPELVLVQTKEIKGFDVSTLGALTSLSRRSFEGHGRLFTDSTSSNQDKAFCCLACDVSAEAPRMGLPWCCWV